MTSLQAYVKASFSYQTSKQCHCISFFLPKIEPIIKRAANYYLVTDNLQTWCLIPCLKSVSFLGKGRTWLLHQILHSVHDYYHVKNNFFSQARKTQSLSPSDVPRLAWDAVYYHSRQCNILNFDQAGRHASFVALLPPPPPYL